MFTHNKSRAGRSFSELSHTLIKQEYTLEKCRVCLNDGEIPIFGVNDISEDVAEFGKIEVDKDDNLPQYLCEACYKMLGAAILFRKTAKRADEILRKPVYSDSGSEDSDYKQESEPYIKREYLEFDNTSDSELDDFDISKHDSTTDNESTNNPTISKVDTHEESNDYKNYTINSVKVEEQDESNHEADNEMIMIIVSDKDKQKLAQPGCETCHITFETVEKLKQHNVETHLKELSNQRECEICHNIVKKTSYRDHLKIHRQKYKDICDKKYRKVECEICCKKISKSYYKQHMKMHGTPEEQAERLIECPICNKKFSTHYYNNHIRRVHDKKKHKNMFQNVKVGDESPKKPKFNKCPVCDKKIKESEYKLHLARHGGSLKRYVCDKCGKEFKHPSAFKTHCLTHGSELKFKCQFCPYRGLHQGLLKVHVRTHTGDYNYKCTECPARFITKSNLSIHLQRHKGICNFICEICQKGFYAKRDLDKHITNVHLSVRNHICEVCGKGFAHRDNMLCHQLKVHKREKIISRGRMPSYLKAERMLLAD